MSKLKSELAHVCNIQIHNVLCTLTLFLKFEEIYKMINHVNVKNIMNSLLFYLGKMFQFGIVILNASARYEIFSVFFKDCNAHNRTHSCMTQQRKHFIALKIKRYRISK